GACIGELDALRTRSSANIIESEVRWSPPGGDFIKINYDAAFQKHSLRSCTRVIIRNQVGDTLVSSIVQNKYIPTEFAVEALACLQAVWFGLDLELQEVIIQGDALTVVKRLPDKNRNGSVISTYVEETTSGRRSSEFELRGGAVTVLSLLEWYGWAGGFTP
ncbi:hypothetical protein Goshw_014045, partial [Gossypium schwendimanii]|nr:hypothetical protein [Gossypium schwendimanii]